MAFRSAFNTSTLKQIFWKQMPFSKNWSTVETTKIESTSFPFETALSKACSA